MVDDYVHYIHTERKPFCASRRLALPKGCADTMCMARGKTYLREWRKHRGKTLVAVAESLHMSHSQLSRIERGDQPYNQELLEALADLYMCDVIDLIIRDPSDPEGIWTLWERAKPGDRQRIVAVADALLKEAG
jgi:transcriptional regulator with XRE-family HTH domain